MTETLSLVSLCKATSMIQCAMISALLSRCQEFSKGGPFKGVPPSLTIFVHVPVSMYLRVICIILLLFADCTYFFILEHIPDAITGQHQNRVVRVHNVSIVPVRLSSDNAVLVFKGNIWLLQKVTNGARYGQHAVQSTINDAPASRVNALYLQTSLEFLAG